MLGMFATTAVNPSGANGLFFGGADFFLKETFAVIACSLYAFIFSYFALFIINKITPVRVTEEEEEKGLDSSLHSENAYNDGTF